MAKITIAVGRATVGDTIELLNGGSSFGVPVTSRRRQTESERDWSSDVCASELTGAHDIAVKLSDAAGNSTTSPALTVTIDTTVASLTAPDLQAGDRKSVV